MDWIFAAVVALLFSQFTKLLSCIKSSVADPVHFFSDPDPDPTSYMFLMFCKINICRAFSYQI